MYISAYTFEVVGVGRVSGLIYISPETNIYIVYMYGFCHLLGVGCDVILSATLQRAPILGHSCMYVKEGIAK